MVAVNPASRLSESGLASFTAKRWKSTIRNHGPAVRLTLVSSDHSGKVVTVEPPALEPGAGAEGIATVQLTVPADASPKSKASIRLTATSDGTAAVPDPLIVTVRNLLTSGRSGAS
jgi:hypothetical protein